MGEQPVSVCRVFVKRYRRYAVSVIWTLAFLVGSAARSAPFRRIELPQGRDPFAGLPRPLQFVVMVTDKRAERIVKNLLDKEKQYKKQFEIPLIVSTTPGVGEKLAKENRKEWNLISYPRLGSLSSFQKDAVKKEIEGAILDAYQGVDVRGIALARYYFLLTQGFLDRFPWRVINSHSSLLPKYPGFHAAQQAIDAGEKEAGSTLHFATEGADKGPIIAQKKVHVFSGDKEKDVLNRIIGAASLLYPKVLKDFGEGKIRLPMEQLNPPLVIGH